MFSFNFEDKKQAFMVCNVADVLYTQLNVYIYIS